MSAGWDWLGWIGKFGRRKTPLIDPALWAQTLAHYPFLTQRSAAEVARLQALSALFLAEKEFHGAQGLVITDAMALAIAAQACLPVLHFGSGRQPLAWYDDFVGIVVHPDEVVARRTVQDDAGVVHQYDEVLAGEAMPDGPVMLSWHDVLAADAESGYSVVIHEFVHKLDLRDGQADGCPALPRSTRPSWLATLQTAFEAHADQVSLAERFGAEPPWLDPYGAESISEFFAVASEAYFVNRLRFTKAFPTLTPLFDHYYRGTAAGA